MTQQQKKAKLEKKIRARRAKQKSYETLLELVEKLFDVKEDGVELAFPPGAKVGRKLKEGIDQTNKRGRKIMEALLCGLCKKEWRDMDQLRNHMAYHIQFIEKYTKTNLYFKCPL